MNKKAILKKLVEYFEEKGSILSPTEYKAADDAPMRYMVAKRAFGSWARMQQMARKAMGVPAVAVAAPAEPKTEAEPKAPKAPKAAKAPKAKVAPKKATK
jgi:hypothetical protein